MPRKKLLESEGDSIGTAVAEPEELTDPTPAPAPTAAPAPPTTRRALLTSADYKSMSIWQAFERMSEHDWSDKMLYVQRVAPFTINATTQEKYGCQLKGTFNKFTKADLQSMLGGGRFKLWLNDSAGNNVKLGTEELSGEPKLLENEVLKSRAEQSAVAAVTVPSGMDLNGVKDLLRMFLENQRQERVEAGDNEGASAINKSIELMSQASLKANQLVADASRAPSLNDQLGLVKQLLEISSPKQDDTTKLLLKTILERAFPAQAAPAANPAQQLKESVETLKSLKELWGEAEGAATGDWKTMIAAALVPAIPQFLAYLRQSANRPPQVIVMQPGPGGQMIPVPQRATPQTLDTVPIEPGSAGVPPASGQTPDQVGGRAPEPPAPTPNGGPPAGHPRESGDLLSGDPLKLKVVTMYLRGKDGSLVASFIEDASPTVYNGLRALDAATIASHFQGDPILKEIATDAGITEWLKEFCDYMHEEGEGAPEGPPPATPAAAPVQ